MSALAMSDQKTSLEETLRDHTREILSRVRQVPGLGMATTTTTTATTTTTGDLEVNKIQNLPLTDLFRPSNHVFLGVWQRTPYTSGAWPLCLSGAKTARVGVSGYDAPTGVVWRFVHPKELPAAASSSHAYLELVDHSLFASGEQHLYLSRDLALVSSTMEAALFYLERVPSFRNGPADNAIRLSLDSGISSSAATSSRLLLCTTGMEQDGSGGDVLLVHSDRVDRLQTDGATYTYNVAFETTPDSDATVQLELSNDDVPLDRYMDYKYRMQ